MPGDEVTLIQLCGKCNLEVGTFTVKRDNMMLSTTDQVWCPHCEAHTPEIRDVAGRRAAIQKEVDSYPKATQAKSLRDAPPLAGPSP